MLFRIPARHRSERDEQQIRKGDAQHLHREVLAALGLGETRGEDPDQPGRREHADQGHQRQGGEQRTRGVVQQVAQGHAAVLLPVFREDRHKGL
jgi:hypothetical protein